MENYRPADSRSLAEILTDLKDEIGELIREELNLARVELTEKSRRVRRGARSVMLGGVVALAGFLSLVASAILALDLLLEAPWLSSLVVGSILALTGLVALGAARKHFNDLAPREMAASLRRSRELLEKHVPTRTPHLSS